VIRRARCVGRLRIDTCGFRTFRYIDMLDYMIEALHWIHIQNNFQYIDIFSSMEKI
jgi:hypothetical protein